MLVKRYHAEDISAVRDTIIKELGSDAVILNTRKIRQKGPLSLFKKRVLEVMVAYDPAKIPAAKQYFTAQEERASARESTVLQSRQYEAEMQSTVMARQAEQLAHLDTRIDSIDRLLSDFISKFSHTARDVAYNYTEPTAKLLACLIENQVREELAHAIARETDAILRSQEASNAREVMEHLILELLGRPDPVQTRKFKRKVVLLLGPTGVGKTTTLVKLAANFSVKQKKKVGIINTDTFRIAAQEQIKTYADILSIPLAIVYQASELEETLEAMSDREVIFIDTAGKRPGDEQHCADIKRMIEICAPEDVLLCVAATTSFGSIKEVIDTYSFIENFKLLVTKLDETSYRGMMLNLSWYAKRNLAYVTTGQNVPDDIEQIDLHSIANELLTRR